MAECAAALALLAPRFEDRADFLGNEHALDDLHYGAALRTPVHVVADAFEQARPIYLYRSDTVDKNNLTGNDSTLFVDPASYDYRLVAGSTYIDAGEDLGIDLLPDDPDKSFLGAAPDVGAVETE